MTYYVVFGGDLICEKFETDLTPELARWEKDRFSFWVTDPDADPRLFTVMNPRGGSGMAALRLRPVVDASTLRLRA